MNQLWTITTPSMQLPLFVRWESDFAFCVAAVPFLGKQHEALNAIVKGLGGNWLRGKWVIPGAALREAGVQHNPVINPEELLTWNPAAAAIAAVAHVPQTGPQSVLPKEQQEFVRAFWQAHPMTQDLSAMVQLWHQLMFFALEWLVNKGKPLDMGFAVLVPTPFRANWKSILTQVHPSLGHKLNHLPLSKKATVIVDAGAAATMADPYMLAYNHKFGIIHWGIDVVLRKDWHRNTLKLEQRRLAAKGRTGYARLVFDTVRKNFGNYVECIASWTKEISIPCAEFLDGITPGNFLLRPFIPKHKVRPAPAKGGEIPVVVPVNILPRIREDMAAAPALLPQMSNLQPDEQDMRDARSLGG